MLPNMLSPFARSLACIRVVVPNWVGSPFNAQAWLREAVERELPHRLAQALPSLQAFAVYGDRFWVTELQVYFKPIGWRDHTPVENTWWQIFGDGDSRSCACVSEKEGERIYSEVMKRAREHRARMY